MTDCTHTIDDTIDTLESYRGHGTELISVYLPPDRSLAEVRRTLATEHADASNIKSKQTRKRVQRALTMLESTLEQYTELPETGVALFSGVLEDDTGTTEVVEHVEPPAQSIETYRYHCDKTFLMEPLRELAAPDNLVGLVVVDVGRAQLGVLRGSSLTHLETLSSYVPPKHRQGGQSAPRFQRRRQEAIDEFYRQVGATASEYFTEYGDSLTGIVLGGPLQTRTEFSDGTHFQHSLRDKVLGVLPVSDTTERGLTQLVNQSQDLLADHEHMQQRAVVEEFFTALRNETAVYGQVDVHRAAELGAIETLLVSEDTSIDDGLSEQVTAYGGEVLPVTQGFEEGERFASVFTGVGAILRFPIN